MPPTSVFGPIIARHVANRSNPTAPGTQPPRGYRFTGAQSGKGGQYAAVVTGPKSRIGGGGRSGVTPQSAQNATAKVFQFTDTLTAGNAKSYPLTSDGDWVSASFAVSVTATGNSTSQDNLQAIAQINIIAADGPIINLVPALGQSSGDFYNFAQRFGPLHARPAIVWNSVATAIQGSYKVYGLNLPQARGPYTMQIVIPAASSFGTQGSGGCTALSVTVKVSLDVGAGVMNRTRFVGSYLPFTPAASAVFDLAPLATIQDLVLHELFIDGLTNNAQSGATLADIAYIQALVGQATIIPRTSSDDLVTDANSSMTSALPATVLFPLFALNTSLTLGRGTHFYIQYSTATPATTTVRLGYYWLD